MHSGRDLTIANASALKWVHYLQRMLCFKKEETVKGSRLYIWMLEKNFCCIYSPFFLSGGLLCTRGMLNNTLTFSFCVLNLNAVNVITFGMCGEKRYQVLLFRLNCGIADWYFSMHFHYRFCHEGSVSAFRKMEWCNYQVHAFINPSWLEKASSSSPVAHS